MNKAEFYLEDLASKFAKINPSDYYLAYSGGRDSHFLLWFIREYLHETRIPAVFSNTGMEIPEIRERALANADVILKPVMKHAEIKERFGIPLNTKESDKWVWEYQRRRERGIKDEDMPNWLKYYAMRQFDAIERGRKKGRPFSAVNIVTYMSMIAGNLHKVSPFCCKYLKKEPAYKYAEQSGRKSILGMMGSESILRKTVITSCFNKKREFRPLWDLTEELRNEIEVQYDIPVPYIYKYVHQTGCAGCPYGQHGKNPWKNTDIELSSCGAGQQKFILDYFKESYEFKNYHFQPIMFL